MKLLLSAFLLLTAFSANAQPDTLAFQDFEVTPEAPVWNFTGPVIYNSGYSSGSAAPANSPLGIGGSRAWETTTNSGGLVLDFSNTVIPAGYDTIRVRFNLAAMNLVGTSGGPDNLDYVLVAYSTDGGVGYTNRLRIRGALADNSYWGYDATGVASVSYLPAAESTFQPTNSGLQTTFGYSTCEIVFPADMVSQLAIRITARSSSSTDTWMIDNLVMTGESNCPATHATVTETACGSFTWPQNGETYTTSGLYNDTVPNAAGCDSIITLDLSILDPTFATQAAASCESYTWTQNGATYFASGLYNDTIANAAGCDSIITLDLTILSPTSATQTVTSCDSYTWSQNGATYFASGLYSDTIANAAGCDSVITLDLTIHQGTLTVQSEVACGSYTWPENGQTYTQSGNYNVTYQTVHGCDSIITLDVYVGDQPTGTISDDGLGTLTAIVPGGFAGVWIDCSTGLGIPSTLGEQTFTPSQNGNYAVVVYDSISTCPDTSDCYELDYLGVNDQELTVTEVFPNPATDAVTITFTGTQAVLTVYDAKGRLQQQTVVENGALFSIESFEKGVYFFELSAPAGRSVVKIVKE